MRLSQNFIKKGRSNDVTTNLYFQPKQSSLYNRIQKYSYIKSDDSENPLHQVKKLKDNFLHMFSKRQAFVVKLQTKQTSSVINWSLRLPFL